MSKITEKSFKDNLENYCKNSNRKLNLGYLTLDLDTDADTVIFTDKQYTDEDFHSMSTFMHKITISNLYSKLNGKLHLLNDYRNIGEFLYNQYFLTYALIWETEKKNP